LNGDLYARDINAGLSSQWVLTSQDRIIGSVSLGRITYANTDHVGESWDTAWTWHKSLSNDDAFSVTLSAGNTDSSDRTSLINNRRGISANYDFGRVWESIDLGVSLSRSWREFEPSSIAPDGREDVKTTGTVSFGFPMVELYGFSPLVRIEASDTLSNAARYQMNRVTFDMSFQSNF